MFVAFGILVKVRHPRALVKRRLLTSYVIDCEELQGPQGRVVRASHGGVRLP